MIIWAVCIFVLVGLLLVFVWMYKRRSGQEAGPDDQSEPLKGKVPRPRDMSQSILSKANRSSMSSMASSCSGALSSACSDAESMQPRVAAFMNATGASKDVAFEYVNFYRADLDQAIHAYHKEASAPRGAASLGDGASIFENSAMWEHSAFGSVSMPRDSAASFSGSHASAPFGGETAWSSPRPATTTTSDATSGQQETLCPLLVVPDGARLACVVPKKVRRRKQAEAFNVVGMPSRGGVPLFRVRIAEIGLDEPRIYVETLGGKEQLAYLSTEALWQGEASGQRRPALSIHRPHGARFGLLEKRETGAYRVLQNGQEQLLFVGDFQAHHVQVVDARGQTVAYVSAQGTPADYQVYVNAGSDAGLIMLALMGIDKCELLAEQ